MSRIARTVRRSATVVSRSRRRATLLAVVLLGAGISLGAVAARRSAATRPALSRSTVMARPLGLTGLRHPLRGATSPVAARALVLGRRAVDAGLARAARTSVRGMLASAAAIGIAVVVVSTGAAGTFAFINASAPASSVSTVSSGSLAVTVTASGSISSIPATTWTNLLPGDTGRQDVVIANTGAAPVTLTGVLGATPSPYSVAIAYNKTCAAATAYTSMTATATALSASSLAKGASVPACVQVTLPSSAANGAQGAANTFQLTIDAKQVTS
ncbi:hypothetical protein [Schumannella sp. 10F1B-5-1]|uniref:hypothetical protein n=1 Tax=Schumannella sp. 10F1B-5-1 TaxID=2590780 RepID=UPI0011308B97|nr:hypothetical protein [Schumannella sp. 10F1B-5-1]TPW70030.1 hypothetical protein FJ658_13405 [Schumannella sp. 10F1B-5-1]